MSSKVRWRTPFNHRWHHESRCCNVSHCLLVCSTRFLNTFQIKCFTVNTVKDTHWSDTILTGLIKWITVIRTTGLHCCGPAEVHPVMVTAFPWRCCSGTSHDAWNLEVGHLQLSRSPSHSWNGGWVYWWGFSVVTFGHTKSNRAALICVYITSLTTRSRAEFPGMDCLNWDQPVTTPAPSPLKQEDVAIVRLMFHVNGVVLFAFM